MSDASRQKCAEIVHVLTGWLPRHDLQWIVDELNDHLDQVSTHIDEAVPRPRVGTIDPELLEQLDVRGTQAREAVEQ